MSRLHNLEVLAAREQQNTARSPTYDRIDLVLLLSRKRPVEEQKPDLWRPHENEDFGLLLNRIEIIKSDFDVVAQVCGRLSPGSACGYNV